MGFKNTKDRTFIKNAIKGKLETINRSINELRDKNIPIPESMIAAKNKLETKLNPNKYNAKKREWNEMQFDSTVEMEYAQLLTKMGIVFEHHRVFVLMEKFELTYKGNTGDFSEKIRSITYEPDFVIDDKIIIDVKGEMATQTRTFEDKWKLLKNIHRDRYYYILVGNKSEAMQSISHIKRILGI